MAATMKISNAAVLAAIDEITGLLNVGGAGRIDILDGTPPADVSVAIGAQTVLASLTLSNPAFASATDQGGSGRATANAVADDTSANAAGTATWFRAYDGNGLAVMDGNAGVVDEALLLNNADFALNDTVKVTAWTISLAE